MGELCPIEGHRLYGYVTNTSTKFILVVDDGGETMDISNKVDEFFRRVHLLFANTVCNPFQELSETPPHITSFNSSHFDKQVLNYVAAANQEWFGSQKRKANKRVNNSVGYAMSNLSVTQVDIDAAVSSKIATSGSQQLNI